MKDRYVELSAIILQNEIKNGCPDCGGTMRLQNSKFGMFYGCDHWPVCECKHGAHQNNGRPLGIPASAKARLARIDAHNAFDKLWLGKDKRMKRYKAYAWMKRTFPEWVPHIGSFNIEQCNTLIAKLKDEFSIAI